MYYKFDQPIIFQNELFVIHESNMIYNEEEVGLNNNFYNNNNNNNNK